MAKNKQIDLEDAIQLAMQNPKAEPGKWYETMDIVTGELFQARTPRHYDPVDPKPFAPTVDLPRPSLRQRVENLINREPNVMARFVADQSTDEDYEIPDDPEAPLTPSEQNYLDMVASDIAEQAPLPDDDLPRNPSRFASQASTEAESGEGGEEAGSQNKPAPAAPEPAQGDKKPPKTRR